MDQVILVDSQDNELGTQEKYAAHRIPVPLHRAFSVFVFNEQGELLITQRAAKKYHWGGFWSNTCCSHPRPGEPVALAAQRRLEEELGFTCEVESLFTFIYKADFDHDWGEHEFDHVFVGTYNGPVVPHPEEVGAIQWIDPAALQQDMAAHPEKYTPWFKICLKRVLEHTRA